MPVGVGQLDYDGNQHRKRRLFVGLEYRQEVVILEEAHGAVGDLQMTARYALDHTLEQPGNQRT